LAALVQQHRSGYPTQVRSAVITSERHSL
jgi:hypothetical protein